MTPFAWLLGLLLPACGAEGAQGLPAPALMDMTHLVRPANPNTALAAPPRFAPPPDIVTPVYPVPPAGLLAALDQVARTTQRTYPAATFPDQMQRHYVVRSAMLNFPDLVTAQVSADGPDHSTLILYSRSVYGYSDFGVNRRRVESWLAALSVVLHSNGERPTP